MFTPLRPSITPLEKSDAQRFAPPPSWNLGMTTKTDTRRTAVEIANLAFTQRLEQASSQFKQSLLEKAAKLREAAHEGETVNARVLELADELERLANSTE